LGDGCMPLHLAFYIPSSVLFFVVQASFL
jgi:hypothetical protein